MAKPLDNQNLEWLKLRYLKFKEVAMGLPQISGVVGGILAIIGGIIVIVKPQIIAWVLGIYLIIFGIFAVLAALGIT